METVAAALVAVENSQPEVARLLLDVAASILQVHAAPPCCDMWLSSSRVICLY